MAILFWNVHLDGHKFFLCLQNKFFFVSSLSCFPFVSHSLTALINLLCPQIPFNKCGPNFLNWDNCCALLLSSALSTGAWNSSLSQAFCYIMLCRYTFVLFLISAPFVSAPLCIFSPVTLHRVCGKNVCAISARVLESSGSCIRLRQIQWL